MKRRVGVANWIAESRLGDFDLAIFSAQESDRAAFMPRRLAAAAKNVIRAAQDDSANDLRDTVLGVLSARGASHSKVLVDISCLSRQMMATIVEAAWEAAARVDVSVFFVYALAAFSPPSGRQTPPNEDIVPASEFFAGWAKLSSGPTDLIMGLGYEEGKAEGACEYFDVPSAWLFVPESPIGEYDEAVARSNESLIGRISDRSRIIKYNIANPAETFGRLLELLSARAAEGNPVMLPFGPKIFFVLCLVAGILYEEAGVWRVTGDDETNKSPETSSGIEIGFKVDFDNRFKSDGN